MRSLSVSLLTGNSLSQRSKCEQLGVNTVETSTYIKLSEAAEIAGVSVFTLRRRIKAGWIKGYRFGTQVWHVEKSELQAALRGDSTGPARSANEAPPLTDEQLQTIVTLLSGQLAAPSSK
jgi:excisionase family DNA binding protein